LKCRKLFSIRDAVAIISCQYGKYHQLCIRTLMLRITHFKLFIKQWKSLNKCKALNFKSSFKNPVFQSSTEKETRCYELKKMGLKIKRYEWIINLLTYKFIKKDKGLTQQAKVAQGVMCWLRPRIFLTFGTTRVAGCQPYAPAAFTPGEIPGTHFFRGWVDPMAHGSVGSYRKNPQWHYRESIPRPSH
jgi:hypothetical protein